MKQHCQIPQCWYKRITPAAPQLANSSSVRSKPKEKHAGEAATGCPVERSSTVYSPRERLQLAFETLPLRESIAMNRVINGETQVLNRPLTLAGLVEQLQMKPDRVAIELNRNIVARDQWSKTSLAEGDRLEIVHFVGGG